MKGIPARIAGSLTLLACISLTPDAALAQAASQAGTSQTDSEQVLRDILSELRQLRSELVRVSVNAHRAQVILERARLQQEQIIRLTREITDIRDALSQLKVSQLRAQEKAEDLNKKREAGVVSNTAVKAADEELAYLNQREQRLADQESRSSAELDSTRAALLELSRQLDAIEREMAPQTVEPVQPKKKS